MKSEPTAFLDRRAARLLALAPLALALTVLAYIHRDDLWPRTLDAARAPEDSAFNECLAARDADIRRLVQENMVRPEQAPMFLSRAEGACRAQTQVREGFANTPGPPPGMTPARK